MKKKLLLLSLALSLFSGFAQNYVLDPTFGNGGVKINAWVNFTPKDVLIINGSYYFMSDRQICKVNYNGTIDTSFGQDGMSTPATVGYESLRGFVYSDGYIYTYGNVPGSTLYINKIGLNGQLVQSFGVNGKKAITPGGNILFSDMIIKNNTLLCLATKNQQMALFKADMLTGNVDTSFSTAGYKEYASLVSDITTGHGIEEYGNDIVLVGKAGPTNLMVIKINNDGTPQTSFGTAGYKYFDITDRGITNVKLYNDKIYMTWSAYVFNLAFGGLDITDMNTGTTTSVPGNTVNHIQIDQEGVVMTGGYICFQTGCSGKFNLRKLLHNGQPDPLFMNGSTYEYGFPFATTSNAGSFVLHKDDEGRIMLAGFNYAVINQNNVPTQHQGFTYMRLIDEALSTDSFKQNAALVYPNPFTNILNINTSAAVKEVEIFDLSGRALGRLQFNNETYGASVLTDGIRNPGAYILKVTTETGTTSTHKIVKQ